MEKNLRNSTMLNGVELWKVTKQEVVVPKDPSTQPDGEGPKLLLVPPPYPKRFTETKKVKEEEEILNTIHKVEVNIVTPQFWWVQSFGV